MSARRRRIVLGPRASDDLSDILLYSEQQWGKRQREAYRRLLYRGFRTLADFPELGRERPDYGPGTSSFRIQQHVVIYQTTDTEMRVSRILHVRRDIDSD